MLYGTFPTAERVSGRELMPRAGGTWADRRRLYSLWRFRTEFVNKVDRCDRDCGTQPHVSGSIAQPDFP